jgi:hypothetical protein
MIKSRRMRWTGHEEQMREKRNTYDIGRKARKKKAVRKTKTYVEG